MSNLEYYKSDKGIYVALEKVSWRQDREYFIRGDYFKCKVNGKEPTPTHHSAWIFIEGESKLKTYSKLVSGGYENYRWELKDSAPEAIKDLTPKTISLEDSFEWYDDDDDVYSNVIGNKCEYYAYAMFYERVSDKQEDFWEEQPIDIKFLGEIESNWVSNPLEAKYSIPSSSSKHTHSIDITKVATYSELSKMMTEDLLLINQPCSITSTQTYNIVRKHINDNINPKWAVVTSDYDFCFTVKKKIEIKPFIEKTEITKSNNRSYAKPRFNTREIRCKTSEIFEMTHAERSYQRYTPIRGFQGDTLQELIDNVDSYLEELMTFINVPLVECEHCSGTGHHVQDSFEVNKR